MRDLEDSEAIQRYVAAAEQYFRDIADPEALFDKPYVPRESSAANVVRLGYLLEHLRHGVQHTVLDFGAGMCWLTIVLARMGCRVIALDVSPTALELGQEAVRRAGLPDNTPEPEFVVYDGVHFPIPDASVDRIACYDAMHHVPNKRNVLREMYRVLRPGGLACFVEPGPGHSSSPAARHEVARWDVLEDEIDVAEFCAFGAEAGFNHAYALPLVFPTEPPMSPQQYHAVHRGARERVLDWHGNDALVTLIKGEYVSDSRRPSRLLARVEVLDLPPSVAPRAIVSARVRVTNTGDTRWLRVPPTRNLPVDVYRKHIEESGLQGLVAVGVHLCDLQFATVLERDYGRGFLQSDVEPGDSCEVALTFRSPERDDIYGLQFDMVDEYVTWFADAGSPLEYEYLRVSSGAFQADSRSPGRPDAQLRLVAREAPEVLVIEAENRGDTTWLRGPLARGGHVQLGAQRLDREGRLIERDWVRAPLPRSVPPGEAARVRLDLSPAVRGVAAPAVLIDLVSEGRCWFAERGSSPLRVALDPDFQ